MLKIILTGPESTGKSALCKQLSKHFNSPFIVEYARKYINSLNHEYKKEDIVKIAKGQLQLEKQYEKERMLFCDTDLLTLKIWSEYKYGKCDAFILNNIEKQSQENRLYLLCIPDIPWKKDNQREHPMNRKELTYIYKEELKNLKRNLYVISGEGELRLKNAIVVLNSFTNLIDKY